MADLKSIAKKLNKAYALDNMIVTADMVPQYARLGTTCLGVDYPMYGGLPYGRIVSFSGPEHSGKTLSAFVQIAAYQRENPDKVCVFVDIEHSADLMFTELMTKVDLDKLYYVNPDVLGGEQILDLVVELQQAEDIGMIVVDSIPALLSAKKMDADIEKNLGMSGHMAASIQTFLSKMQPLVFKANNILLLINQVRISKTPTGAILYHEPGGSAMGFVPSVKVRFGTRTFVKGDNVDSRDGQDADGFRLNFVITKNKTADVRRGGGFITFDYKTGVNITRDAIDIAKKFGYIIRPTNSTYILADPLTGEYLTDTETGKELKFVGIAKVYDYLNEHPKFTEWYAKALISAINGSDIQEGLLEGERLQEILDQENAVERNNK